ncbi:MAG: GTPase ObgE [Actinobacteria bacterium]|nr:GTPase ObgE [Actinomycetota bacterium]
MFVDEAIVRLRAGDGGAGVASFHRERGRPRGRPEGGSGGRGGSIVVLADSEVATLLEYRRHPHRRAGDGTHGRGDLQHGRQGADLVLGVPVGTVVRDAAGVVLADLTEPGARVVLVEGGRGGRGNAALAGPRHVAPTFAEQGEYGEEAEFTFELKLLADAAIIGFPNAGKSTLIARVSAARPKVADYPFTTLEPNLGVVEVDERQFVLADIPGLVAGAAEGRGLGHAFLRHAERARALVLLLDPSPLQEVPVAAQHGVLVEELRRHDPALAARPRLVAVNKADLSGAAEAAAALAAALDGEVHLVSAVTGAGLPALMHAVADLVDRAVREAPERPGYLLHRPAPPGFSVHREGERWVVRGKAAERAVALDDLTVPAAADFAARRLTRAGVDEALRRAGARPGDEVQIGDLVFEFQDEAEQGGKDGEGAV